MAFVAAVAATEAVVGLDGLLLQGPASGPFLGGRSERREAEVLAVVVDGFLADGLELCFALSVVGILASLAALYALEMLSVPLARMPEGWVVAGGVQRRVVPAAA